LIIARDNIEENELKIAISERLPYFAYDRPFRAFTKDGDQVLQRRLHPAACTTIVAQMFRICGLDHSKKLP
jgi:hypothetical protein